MKHQTKLTLTSTTPEHIGLKNRPRATATGPGCGEGTNLRLRDFAVVPLMPTRVIGTPEIQRIWHP